jgi:hypothetical protein
MTREKIDYLCIDRFIDENLKLELLLNVERLYSYSLSYGNGNLTFFSCRLLSLSLILPATATAKGSTSQFYY